jgi:hypothetical protein
VWWAAAACLVVLVVAGAVVALRHDNNDRGPAVTSEPTTTPVVTRDEVTMVLGQATDAVPNAWEPLVELPYGAGNDQLGLADTHGGETAAWGPEYLAPGADGSLFVLDTEKRRVAHFDHAGTYLDDVTIPGAHVGLQMPFMLGDTFWASGGSGDALIIDGQGATRVDNAAGSWIYSDGTSVFNVAGTALLPTRPPTVRADKGLRTPAGTLFVANVSRDDPGAIHISLPTAGSELTVRLTASDGGAPVNPVAFEVSADVSDRLEFLVYGLDESSPDLAHRRQLAGFFTVDARTGEVSPIEPMRNPSSPADPGSPGQLRVIPGSTSLLLTFVDADAVRVYQRDWPESPFLPR